MLGKKILVTYIVFFTLGSPTFTGDQAAKDADSPIAPDQLEVSFQRNPWVDDFFKFRAQALDKSIFPKSKPADRAVLVSQPGKTCYTRFTNLVCAFKKRFCNCAK